MRTWLLNEIFFFGLGIVTKVSEIPCFVITITVKDVRGQLIGNPQFRPEGSSAKKKVEAGIMSGSKSGTCEMVTVDGVTTCEGNLQKSDVLNSKTSISGCSCGPECGPDKCEGRNRAVLLGWDSLRTKIFICLFVAFVIWLAVYVPISLTILNN